MFATQNLVLNFPLKRAEAWTPGHAVSLQESSRLCHSVVVLVFPLVRHLSRFTTGHVSPTVDFPLFFDIAVLPHIV